MGNYDPEKYLRDRKPRQCPTCDGTIPFGRRGQRICDVCRSKPPTTCIRCKLDLPLDRFSQDRSRPSGYFPWCKSCQTESNLRKIRETEPHNGRICPLCEKFVRGHTNRVYCSHYCKERTKRITKGFGLTLPEYKRLVADTGGKCPICNEVPEYRWAIDHNHREKRVTGVVCNSCNIGALAATFHDVEFVRSLLRYLENTPAQRLGIEAEVSDVVNGKPSNLHTKWRYATLKGER